MIMERIEDVILDEKPDCVVIYGDTNSTLAAALAASKQHFPVVHIEAGMRSFNKTMPEELNRIMADHASTLLIAPTNAAFKNLMAEGFRPENVAPYSINNPRVFLTGDIMYDNSLFYADLAERKKQDFLAGTGVGDKEFVLVTIHRDSNTDDPERLSHIQHDQGVVRGKLDADDNAPSPDDNDCTSEPRSGTLRCYIRPSLT
jgi:UDP-GlcNAc3NAcA epimerase